MSDPEAEMPLSALARSLLEQYGDIALAAQALEHLALGRLAGQGGVPAPSKAPTERERYLGNALRLVLVAAGVIRDVPASGPEILAAAETFIANAALSRRASGADEGAGG